MYIIVFGSKKGHLEVVKVLLERGANKEAANKYGERPLNSAIQYGHLEVVNLLIEEDAQE